MEAVQQAVSSPLLETTIKGATHVIINISGDISLMDANDAASYVQELTGEDSNIIFGAMYDDSVADYARITVIATGLSDLEAKSTPFGNRSSASPFSVRKPAAGINNCPVTADNEHAKLQPAEHAVSLRHSIPRCRQALFRRRTSRSRISSETDKNQNSTKRRCDFHSVLFSFLGMQGS